MVQPSVFDASQLLDEFVAAFEAAQRSNEAVDLQDFLPDSDHPLYGEVLCELIRVDLEYGWTRGSAKSVATYATRFPGFFADAGNLKAVAYEEFRLRRQAGEAVTPAEYQARLGIHTFGWPTPSDTPFAEAERDFPQPQSLASDFDRPAASLDGKSANRYEDICRRAVQPADLGRKLSDPAEPAWGSGTEMPQVGDSFAGFRLVAELGRGAFGRVYLARQGELAHRSVALKVSYDRFEESHKLAQLQHTNIVPVYSVHRAAALQAVCMPFFGSTTLVDLIRAIRLQGSVPASGKALVDTLMERRSSLPALAGPACSDVGLGDPSVCGEKHADMMLAGRETAFAGCLPLLTRFTYVEAVLWIGARLADGLSHAHDRGIWHRDLKPANILLADDGQPMLLDFNLSEDTKRLSTPAFVGGTLPYMAPEQLAALRRGGLGGDARSDLYALGVILYEMLSGHHPFPARHGTPDEVLSEMLEDRLAPPQLGCPAVTPAVKSIIAHCLETHPGRRYQTARQLQDDLERQLQHLPLRFAREPSPRERARKWVRRHPRLTSAVSIACLAGTLLAALSVLFVVRGAKLARLEAVETYEQFAADLRLAQVQSLAAATVEPKHWPAIAAACRQALDRFGVLDDRAWQQTSVFRSLPPDKQHRVRGDAGELLFLTAALARLDAGIQPSPAEQQNQLNRALELNRQAEFCYASGEVPGAVWRQRGLLMDQLGRPEARQLLERASVRGPKSTRDLCMLACMYMAEQRHTESLPLWQSASSQDAQNVWAWYGLANCYDRLSKPALAAACYSACISLKPDYNGWYFGRGVAYFKLQEYALSLADFDLVLQREPHHAEALVNRALVRLHNQESNLATEDVTQAIACGANDPRVYLIRADARKQAGDLPGAQLDRERSLARRPTDESGWIARGVALVPVDPQAALADFCRALECNPRSVAALESQAHVLAEKLGNLEQSIAVLDRAIEISPEHAPCIAARGVLLARLGKDASARADAQRAMAIDTSAATLYQVAGIYALTSKQNISDRSRALALLSSALRQGYGSELVDADQDLNPLRGDPQFAQLLQATRTLRATDF